MNKWDVHFNHGLEARDNGLIELFIKVESFKLSVLKIPLPPALAKRIDQLNIVRQIKGTTGIEGIDLSEKEIETIINRQKNSQSNVEQDQPHKEGINSNKVINFIHDETKKDDSVRITEELIKQIHFLTTEGIEYPYNIPGEYRNHASVAGDGSIRYPNHEDLKRLMAEFVEFINSREAMALGGLLRAILAHFYLISIHPFGDGNGRTSRGLEAYILYSSGYNVRGFYSLANYFYKNRAEYVNQLQEARFKHNGRLQEFVLFSLRGFLKELEDIQDEILDFVRIIMFNNLVEEFTRTNEINSRQNSIMSFLSKALSRDELPQIQLSEFRAKKHFLSQALYEKHKSIRTLLRDLSNLLSKELIIMEKGYVRANIGLMDQF